VEPAAAMKPVMAPMKHVHAAAPPAVGPMAPAARAPPAAPFTGVSGGSPPEEQGEHESQRRAIRLHDHWTHTGKRLFTPRANDTWIP